MMSAVAMDREDRLKTWEKRQSKARTMKARWVAGEEIQVRVVAIYEEEHPWYQREIQGMLVDVDLIDSMMTYRVDPGDGSGDFWCTDVEEIDQEPRQVIEYVTREQAEETAQERETKARAFVPRLKAGEQIKVRVTQMRSELQGNWVFDPVGTLVDAGGGQMHGYMFQVEWPTITVDEVLPHDRRLWVVDVEEIEPGVVVGDALQIDALSTEVRALRMQVQDSADQIAAKDAEMEAFKDRVRAKAIEVADEESWCDDGLNATLADLGLDPRIPEPREYVVTVKMRVSARPDKSDRDDLFLQASITDADLTLDDDWSDVEVTGYDVIECEQVDD